MKYDILAVIWNDACEFEEEELNKETFELSPTFQCGLLIDEDEKKIRISHSFSIDDNEHDFIVIPQKIITYRKKIGVFDSKTKKIKT